MKLRKSKTRHEPEAPFPGRWEALDGRGAVAAVERAAGAVFSTQAAAGPGETGSAWWDRVAPAGDDRGESSTLAGGNAAATHPAVESSTRVLGLVTGHALAGLRAAGLIEDLSGALEPLREAAGMRLPFVLHLVCRAAWRHAGSLHGGHDDVHAAASAGAFQLFASSVQEASDFTLIAHRIAELSLTPGVVAQDLHRTSHAVERARLPEADLVREYLGSPGDGIESLTPAQDVLFGGRRPRVPRALDPDHPAGVGGVQDRETYFKALAGQRVYFASHLEELIERAFSEFAELTGRAYAPVGEYRTDDAEFVVVAQGAVLEELRRVVDHLRSEEKIKVGVVGLTVLRPFPGARLSALFQGKRAVTVLERTDDPLSTDPPLSREVRASVDRASENGAFGGDPLPHPDYAAYRKAADRPALLSGVYGAGAGLPAFADLVSVYRNMAAGMGRKPRFYVGLDLARTERRFPHLEATQSRLNRDYPQLRELSLPPDPGAAAPEEEGRSLELHFLSAQGGLFAANLFARTLHRALGENVRTFPEGGLEPSLRPVSVTIARAPADAELRGRPAAPGTLLVSSHNLLDLLPTRSGAREGATLLVGTNLGSGALARGLSPRAARWIRGFNMRVMALDAAGIAGRTASSPAFLDQLELWALLGASVAFDGKTLDRERLSRFLREGIEEVAGEGHPLAAEVADAFARGMEEASEVPPDVLEKAAAGSRAEVEAPWTVREAAATAGAPGGPGDDAVRFWRSVGSLYAAGEPDQAVADPYLSTGHMPAASSAFRDLAPFRLRVPKWLPENCTGCGLCWSLCPDSALPPALVGVDALLETAMSEAEREGGEMIQLRRVSGHLARQAYRLAAEDELDRYLQAGPLLGDAFDRLLEKMDLDEEKLEAIKGEFERTRAVVEEFPVARTDAFFVEPHKREKGTGALLSIAMNPLACKACGLCVEICPEDALEWTEQSPGDLERDRGSWQLQMALPEPDAETLRVHVRDDDPDSQMNRLLARSTYHTLVGGDAAYPGNPAKSAVHLVTAAVESVMRPRFEAHAARLDELIGKVRERIQGKVAEAVTINDFERFGAELDRLRGEDLSAERLAALARDDGSIQAVDAERLERLTDILRELEREREAYAGATRGSPGAGAGSGARAARGAPTRARMILVLGSGPASFWSGTFPYNPHASPWVAYAPGDAAALAEGLFEGTSRRLAREAGVRRRAEAELEDKPPSDQPDPDSMGWSDLTRDERALMPPVLVLGRAEGQSVGDGAGAGDLGRLLSGPYPFRVLLLDGTALDPYAGAGNVTGPIPAGSEGLHLLRSTIGHPGHLVGGVVRSLDSGAPALYHVYAPDPYACGVPPEKTFEQARRACDTRVFPLVEILPGDEGPALDLSGNPDPGSDWTTATFTIREASGAESSFEAPLTPADWAANEARFRGEFRLVSAGRRSDAMRPLSEVLDLPVEERENVEAFVHRVDEEGRHVLAPASPAMVRMAEERRRAWRRLREAAAPPQAGARAAAAGPSAKAPAEPGSEQAPQPSGAEAPDGDTLQQVTERLLWLCGYSRDPEFFKQSLREFVTKSAGAPAGGEEPPPAAGKDSSRSPVNEGGTP